MESPRPNSFVRIAPAEQGLLIGSARSYSRRSPGRSCRCRKDRRSRATPRRGGTLGWRLSVVLISLEQAVTQVSIGSITLDHLRSVTRKPGATLLNTSHEHNVAPNERKGVA